MENILSQDESSRHSVDEAELILACLRGQPFCVPGDIAWRPLLELAEGHRVLPFIEQALLKQHAAIPAFFTAAVQKHRENAERHAQELEQLLEEFARHNIDILPLKGPALAEALYRDATMRSCDDLDLLVRRRDVLKAEKVLFGRGFIARQSSDDYHRKFLHDDLLVELHFNVASPRSFHFDLEDIWNRARHMRFRDVPMLAMSDKDLVLFLCLHGLKHGFSRLIWIVDFAYALAKLPNGIFKVLLQNAQRNGFEQPLLIACEIAGEVLPQQVSADVEATIAASPDARAKARQAVTRLFAERSGANNDPEIWGFYLRTEPGTRQRWQRRLSFLKPTVEDYAWAKRHRIHRGFASVLRPFRLVQKYGPSRAWRILFPPGI